MLLLPVVVEAGAASLARLCACASLSVAEPPDPHQQLVAVVVLAKVKSSGG